MGKKNYWFYGLLALLLVILLFLPTYKDVQDVQELDNLSTSKGKAPYLEEDKKVYEDLRKKLKLSVDDYLQDYNETRESDYYGGHSGAVGPKKNISLISIEVINGVVENYIIRNSDVYSSPEKFYFKYYNTTNEEICELNEGSQDNLTLCKKGRPRNFDSEIKMGIITYLLKIEPKSLTKENSEYGECYLFDYNNLPHIFCFNEDNLLTLAKWGWTIDYENGGYSRQKNTVEIVSLT